MIKIHDITKPYPWPDAEVKYYDAPEEGFESSALEDNWLEAKANALGRSVFRKILLPTGEYEVHMSGILHRIKQKQFELFTEHLGLDIEHDFLLVPFTATKMPALGCRKADNGDYYFHLMEVDSSIRMGSRCKAISQWIDRHSGWMYWYDHGELYCQLNSRSESMPVTTAYERFPDSDNPMVR